MVNIIIFSFFIPFLSATLFAETLYVTNFSDVGIGTLRDAIENSNKSTGETTTVYFSKKNKIISLESDLPQIEKPINIDATDQNITIDSTRSNGFILAKGSDGSVIKGLTIINSKNNGVTLSDSNNHVITGNSIQKNEGSGIFVNWSHDNRINKNVIHKNKSEGIHIFCSNNNHIFYNTIRENSLGILLDSSDCMKINNNSIIKNQDSGIFLAATSFHDNVNDPILSRKKHNHVINENKICDNSTGINLLMASDNYFLHNKFSNNGKAISLIQKSCNNIIEENNIEKSNIGIVIDHFSKKNPLIKNNIFNNDKNINIDYGDEIPPSIPSFRAHNTGSTLFLEGILHGLPNTEYFVQFSNNKQGIFFIGQIVVITNPHGKGIICNRFTIKEFNGSNINAIINSWEGTFGYCENVPILQETIQRSLIREKYGRRL